MSHFEVVNQDIRVCGTTTHRYILSLSNIFAGTFSDIFVLINLDTTSVPAKIWTLRHLTWNVCVCLVRGASHEPWLKSVPHDHPSHANQQPCSADGFLAVVCQ